MDHTAKDQLQIRPSWAIALIQLFSEIGSFVLPSLSRLLFDLRTSSMTMNKILHSLWNVCSLLCASRTKLSTNIYVMAWGLSRSGRLGSCSISSKILVPCCTSIKFVLSLNLWSFCSFESWLILVLVMSAIVSVTAQKWGGKSFQPIYRHNGSTTKAAFLALMKNQVLALGYLQCEDSLCRSRCTGPFFLISRVCPLNLPLGFVVRSRACPYCVATIGAKATVSWLTPDQVQFPIHQGYLLCWGITPGGLNYRLGRSLTSTFDVDIGIIY